MRARWSIAFLAILLAILGAIGLFRSRDGLARTTATVHGVPVELLTAVAPTASPRPGVIVVHGFGGSRQLMYGIGQTLARNGYAAALVDLPGHGRNETRLRAPGTRTPPAFDGPLTYVMAWLRTQPGVDGRTLALVGHSMGAGAVVRFAARDADMLATVAISGTAAGRPFSRAGSPRNLLTLAGAWEFDAVRRGCLAAVTTIEPGAVAGRLYGSLADGTARQCLIVPAAEHISVLFSRTANVAIVNWLDRATGAFPADRTVETAIPMRPALALHVSAALGLLLLITGLFPRPLGTHAAAWSRDAAFADGLPRAAVFVLALVPALLAALAMRVFPTGWAPLLTGDYLWGFLAVTGVATVVGLRQLGVPVVGRISASVACRSLIVAGAASLAFLAIAQAAWLNMWLTGLRPWLAALIWPAWFVMFLGQDRLLRARPAREYFAWAAVSAIGLAAVLVGAVFALRAPFFLVLIVPAFVPLLLVHGAYGHLLRRRTPSSIPAACIHATLFAWLTAAVFPLV